ncbi:hypothetical protein OBBRIDRAFT_806107 [Obba rivulosa]|uniref:Uncharacterized protein n=1 Tax=Obba rivulosa TaxID=1052685 RepID=A0A8E2DGQ6_9APHY|nr:hypothetical protein OBBRIDRAFT_806107 [Obba rivulosa]
MSRWLDALPEPFTSCRPLSQPFAHSKGEKAPESGPEDVKVLESKYDILLMSLIPIKSLLLSFDGYSAQAVYDVVSCMSPLFKRVDGSELPSAEFLRRHSRNLEKLQIYPVKLGTTTRHPHERQDLDAAVLYRLFPHFSHLNLAGYTTLLSSDPHDVRTRNVQATNRISRLQLETVSGDFWSIHALGLTSKPVRLKISIYPEAVAGMRTLLSETCSRNIYLDLNMPENDNLTEKAWRSYEGLFEIYQRRRPTLHSTSPCDCAFWSYCWSIIWCASFLEMCTALKISNLEVSITIGFRTLFACTSGDINASQQPRRVSNETDAWVFAMHIAERIVTLYFEVEDRAL